jgi:hypothetical protein
MGASADTGPGWCLASDKPGALTTSMPRPRGRRLEKTSGRHPLFKEAAPDGGRNGRPGRLERRPPIPPIHPEQTVPPNRRSLSAFGGWWPLTLAKVEKHEGNTIILRTDPSFNSALHRVRPDDVGLLHHQFPVQLQASHDSWQSHFLRDSNRSLFLYAKSACERIRVDTQRDPCTRGSISSVPNSHPFHVLYEVEILMRKQRLTT